MRAFTRAADEAQTECRSLAAMAWTGERLGATPEVARRLASRQATHAYLRMPERYQGGCAAAGQADAPVGR